MYLKVKWQEGSFGILRLKICLYKGPYLVFHLNWYLEFFVAFPAGF